MAVCHVTPSITEGQLAAARALAGFGILELAASTDIVPRALHRLGTGGVICVSEKKRRGHVQRAVWGWIISRSCNSRGRPPSRRRIIRSGGALERAAGAAINQYAEINQEKGGGRYWTHDAPRSQCQRLAQPAKIRRGGSSWSCSHDLFILGGNVLICRRA